MKKQLIHIAGNIIFLTILFQSTCLFGQEVSLNNLKQNIEKEIGRHVEEISVSAWFPKFNTWFELNAHTQFHAASTMKVPVMYDVYYEAEQGKLNLSDSLLVKNQFSSIVDGSPYQMDISEDSDESMYELIGRKSTIKHLVYEMITSSSNLATNILIDAIEAENVQKLMRELGANEIRVLRGVEDIKAYKLGLSNTTTAHDLSLIFKSILEAKKISNNAKNEMIDILTDQFFNDGIPAGLPKDLRVAHKTGSITAIYHDSGIVFTPDDPFVLTVLTRGFEDQKQAQKTVAKITRIIFDWYILRIEQ